MTTSVRSLRRRVPALATLALVGLAACSSTSPATPAAGPAPNGAGAGSPVDAVQRFAAAEIAGDEHTAYALLAADQRAAAGSADAWAAGASQRPRFTSVGAPSGDGSELTTPASLEARLDPVDGFEPARATVRWSTVQEGGAWFVDFDRTTVTPVLPPDAAAGTVAEQWVAARQHCATASEVDGGIVGDISFAASLCGRTGTPVAGPVLPLRGLRNRDAVLTAFGEDADSFTRRVEVTGPADLDVVVAPKGDTWVVVGVASR